MTNRICSFYNTLGLIILLLCAFATQAQTVQISTTLSSGNWSDPTIWSKNQLPQANSVVYLNHHITVDQDFECRTLNTNGYNLTVAPGVHLTVSGLPHVSTYDSLAMYNIPTLANRDTLQSRVILDGVEYFFYGTNPAIGTSKITRAQYRKITDTATVVNVWYNDSLLVKAMHMTVAGVNDSSFYKYTYLDTVTVITRFAVNWQTNNYQLREISASKKSGSFTKSLGISQQDDLDKQIIDVGKAGLNAGIAAVSVVAGVGLIIVAGLEIITITSALAIGAGGALLFNVLLSNANASDAPYQQIKRPVITNIKYDSLIKKHPLLDSATWFGLSTPIVVGNGIDPVGATSAFIKGLVLTSGASAVTARGICWNSDSTKIPTLSDATLNVVAGTGPFSIQVVDLVPGTKYFFRTFATNSHGNSFGGVQTYTPPLATDTIALLVGHGTWKAISGFGVDGLTTVRPTDEDCEYDGEDQYGKTDSLHMTFNANNTGSFYHYGRQWGDSMNADCELEAYNYTEIISYTFTWQYLPATKTISILFNAEEFYIFDILQGEAAHFEIQLINQNNLDLILRGEPWGYGGFNWQALFK